MSRRARALLAAAAALLLAVAPGVLDAQEAPAGVSVAVAFSATNATIGDRAALVVRVEHPEDLLVTVPLPEVSEAEVLNDGEVVLTALPDGRQVTETTFLYQLFDLGPIESGPVAVRWIREDGTSGAFEAPGAQVTVVSVRAPGDEALRPLKPQLSIDGAPPAWLIPGAVAAGVLVILALAVLAIRRFRRPEVEVEAGPADAPERSARERLAALQGARLPDEAEFQRFYGTIAVVVREYLAARFGFHATALTSRELEARMTAHGVDRWQARLVSGLLDRCDRAVYARQYPDPASADHDLTVAFEIVELSRPRDGADAEGGAEAGGDGAGQRAAS
ncbi:MAG: hypothetical protein AB7F65_05065 [Dehalococcoidia bacterium]